MTPQQFIFDYHNAEGTHTNCPHKETSWYFVIERFEVNYNRGSIENHSQRVKHATMH